MGFRTYFGKISKNIINDIEGKDIAAIAQYFNNIDFTSTYYMIEHTEKLCEINFYEENLFTFKKLNWHPSIEICEDSTWEIIDGKNDFEKFIEWSRKQILARYEKLYDCIKNPNDDSEKFFKEKKIKDVEKFLYDMKSEWVREPYNKSRESKSLIKSWKREYFMFDLIRMYKEFDFDNDYLVYMGH